MGSRDRDIDRIGDDPDVEIGATVRAKKLRFKHRPETEVEVHGDSQIDDRLADEIERADVETASGSERRNLPDEVEPGVTYRDVRVRWRAAAKIKPTEERKPGEG
jgi:hypothetical protein